MDATVKSPFIATQPKAPAKPLVFWRPTAKTGLMSWLTTVDHKRIGFLYGFFGLFFFLVGGFEALLIRLQLMFPNNDLLTAQQYNTMFTMHGTTMIFLAVMPIGAAFFNFIMPLQIGARDVAFPRLNAFSLWTFVAGAIIVNIGWFLPDGAPNAGWFGYAPLTSRNFIPQNSVDFWVMGLQLLGVASIAAALNFIVTIINLRAPGLTMMRVPVFTWMTLITSFLIILSFPAITIALVELMMDRQFGTNFFEVSNGGMPILWQHLFWIFGHPEVYILILPAMGIVSEILPTFSRKPLFGYPIVVFSGAAIGFLGFGVWSHHMFTTGMGTVATAAFALATMAIAVPTGVKIFNWIGTIWNGHLQMRTPMMFALGFIWMFMIGGFSGVMHAAAPHDAQQQDSYFVVAHFHYVLIGGSLFALLAGIHYWFPLMFGRKVSEFWGKLSFWVIFVGFNVTFFPMHFLGLNGMPRRTFTYDGNMGWNAGNFVSSVGAIILGLGVAIYFGVMVYTYLKGERVGRDPWDGRTLEWSLPTPPPEYNYAVTPTVHARDAFWYEKHHRDEIAREKSEHAQAEEAHGGIHMPHQSIYPFITSLGILIGAFAVSGLDSNAGQHKLLIAIVGGVIMLAGIYLWALEGSDGYHLHVDKDGNVVADESTQTDAPTPDTVH
ncbi:cytochrome c oxidase subunit I [Opitutus terrae]|uniref:Cytochrome c oxidase subunit 1 n=1 Tax=Opitutus terrae (strain DSM 11246 / JCM 15787 / PB90-1) TaxID=452637 RepID=B1ZMS6_OPITP|nr:cytochrome c oxidase subunit I [Opitutus terrae]ACB75354.1 cytochrome c oxidase, subunit I [Opitutus terrae PB90-1]